MGALVFVGPSAPPELPRDARIEYRPAAVRGDVEAASETHSVIGLIDGRLYDTLAVSPREVRVATSRATVVGGASLGALRALEVPEVVAVGEVYALFEGGQLVDDDELVGTFDELRRRNLAYPLVIVRDAAKRLGDPRYTGVLEALKMRPFDERTLGAIDVEARRLGLDPEPLTVEVLRQPNIKQRDALAVVRAIQELLDSA